MKGELFLALGVFALGMALALRGGTGCVPCLDSSQPGNTWLGFEVLRGLPPAAPGVPVFRGRLTDKSGVPVQGAQVDFVDTETCTVFEETSTDMHGEYLAIPSHEPPYCVQAVFQGSLGHAPAASGAWRVA